MGRDLTTSSTSHQDTANGLRTRSSWRLGGSLLLEAARLLAAMALGALLLALTYQIPVMHTVDIGGYDSAYVQGFYEPERNAPGQNRPELAGSDGSARWTRDTSYLLFPQAGLPAQVTLRLRGWRASGPAPQVSVLLNDSTVLGTFRTGADWQDYTFPIRAGLLKPNDVVIAIRSETASLDPDDPRAVGVLLDRAIYSAGPAPTIPYPPQLLYGALGAGMLYLLLIPRREPRTTQRGDDREPSRASNGWRWSFVDQAWLPWFVSVLVLGSGFLVLYRAQPPYPFPLLRLLPAVDGLLAALLTIRYGPALARRAPAALDGLALGGIGAWAAAVLMAAQSHLTLSLPSVESDFRVFALRSAHLAGAFQPSGNYTPDVDGVFRADGFYNLGYPLLLWLARPFTSDNPFLAARLVAALSGALLLGAGWWLARQMLGRVAALLALLMLALSPLIVEYSLYIGTDMPFAALCVVALALIVFSTGARPTTDDQRRPTDADTKGSPNRFIYHFQFLTFNSQTWFCLFAGLVGGAAFLIRHPGLLLLPFGWLVLWWPHRARHTAQQTAGLRHATWNLRPVVVFTLAFFLATLPQLVVNVRDTGRPFYSQQAKNIWQAVFGQGDWGRWGETANSVTLERVIAQDPQRFLTNWWANLRGYFGTGGEDTREFGQAVQLRLLGFPANWLAIGGLLGWLVGEGKRQKAKGNSSKTRPFALYLFPFPLLLLWIAIYVITLSVGLALQSRFFLPLAPIYALAAAWTVTRFGPATDDQLPTQAQGPSSTQRVPDREPVNDERQGQTHYALRTTQYVIRNAPLIASIVLLVLLWGGFAAGASSVVRSRPLNEAALARAENRAELPGQPADEVETIQIIQATLRPGERLVARVDPRVPIGKYSAVAHLAVSPPASDDPAALRATGAQYLLWDAGLGRAPRVGEAVQSAGAYTLYRIAP